MQSCLRYPLSRNALRIHYLRSGPGSEGRTIEHLMTRKTGVFAAFSRWSLIAYTASNSLYDYRDLPPDFSALTGAPGFMTTFNYLWAHPVNIAWEARISEDSQYSSHLGLLISLHFADSFRFRFGVGAELMFCDFIENLLAAHNGGVERAVIQAVKLIALRAEDLGGTGGDHADPSSEMFGHLLAKIAEIREIAQGILSDEAAADAPAQGFVIVSHPIETFLRCILGEEKRNPLRSSMVASVSTILSMSHQWYMSMSGSAATEETLHSLGVIRDC